MLWKELADCRRRSRVQLPPHPLRVPHSAYLGVEAVGFAEFVLATRIIAQERGELGRSTGRVVLAKATPIAKSEP